MSDTGVARCPGCGHNFYNDAPVRDGLCKWCVDEEIEEALTKSEKEEKA